MKKLLTCIVLTFGLISCGTSKNIQNSSIESTQGQENTLKILNSGNEDVIMDHVLTLTIPKMNSLLSSYRVKKDSLLEISNLSTVQADRLHSLSMGIIKLETVLMAIYNGTL